MVFESQEMIGSHSGQVKFVNKAQNNETEKNLYSVIDALKLYNYTLKKAVFYNFVYKF